MPRRGGRDRAHRDGRDQRLMLRAIDRVHANYTRARALYASWLRRQANGRPLRPGSVPDRREFQRLDERFHDQEQRNFAGAGHRRAGRPRVSWRIEERVIALARTYPVMGSRRIGARVGVDHKTVLRILREEGLRPYKVQVVHELRPGDRTARLRFCRWMLRKIRRNRHFLKNIVFTDESSFSSTSILNRQNVRIWRRRNPHAMVQRVQQGRFSVNVWAGILGNDYIAPVFLSNRLSSVEYLRFLRHTLLNRLRRMVPRNARNRIFLCMTVLHRISAGKSALFYNELLELDGSVVILRHTYGPPVHLT